MVVVVFFGFFVGLLAVHGFAVVGVAVIMCARVMIVVVMAVAFSKRRSAERHKQETEHDRQDGYVVAIL